MPEKNSLKINLPRLIVEEHSHEEQFIIKPSFSVVLVLELIRITLLYLNLIYYIFIHIFD